MNIWFWNCSKRIHFGFK